MKVYIDSKYHDFDSGYNPHNPSDNGWRKQNQDAFKFSIIAGKKVFVKRFEKKASNIPGYPFLVKIKNKKYNSIPMVYDLVKEVENGKEVIYLFQEYIEGNTFEEIMHSGVLHFNPQKFLKNIYDALSVMEQNGFWYADFVEKNIFVAKNGDFYLIDLDSTLPLSILPNDNENIGAVNKNYKIAVSIYWYRDTLGYKFPYIAKNLRGDTINFLELIIFIAQIRYYIDNISHCNFLDVNTRKAIPNYLLDENNALTFALFKSCFQDTSDHQQVPSFMLLENYVSTVLFPENKTVSIDFNNAKIIRRHPKPKPITSNEDKHIDEKKEVIKGLVQAVNYNIDTGDTVVARGYLQQIKNLNPNYPQISALEQKIKEAEDYEDKIKELVEAVNYRIGRGHTKAARNCLQQIKNLNPNYPQISVLEQKIKEAEDEQRQVKNIIKEWVQAANYNIEVGDTVAARNCLQRVKDLYPNYYQISVLEQKIKEAEDEQRQVKNKIKKLVKSINYNIDEIGNTKAARNCLRQIKNIDANYYQISTLEQKIEELEEYQRIEREYVQKINNEKKRLKSRGKSPYKCPNCSFPVVQQKYNSFYSTMQKISAIAIVFILIPIFNNFWALLGIIIGPLIFGIISIFLPKSWFNKKLECKHCHHSYYEAEEKWE